MSQSFESILFPVSIPPEYSILIPSWNNLPMLQLCVSSIQRHSKSRYEILVFVNEGNDGTAKWLKEQKIAHMVSNKNVGICISMNALRTIANGDILCYINDDMYVCPGWDEEVLFRIKKEQFASYFISSTMIEPPNNANPCAILANYGTTLENFKEKELLDSFQKYERSDWSGSSWPPLFLAVSLWDSIGGFSEEFSPGMYSDPDMAMKAWQSGNRNFLGIGSSRVYHFGSKSTKRVKKNKGRQTFILKWGITSRFFYQKYLKMGNSYSGPLPDVKINILDKLINKMKFIKEKWA